MKEKVVPIWKAKGSGDNSPVTYSESDISRIFLANAVWLNPMAIPEFRLVEIFGIGITKDLDLHEKYATNNPIAPHIHTYWVHGTEKFRAVDFEAFRELIRQINIDALGDLCDQSPGQAEITAYRAEQAAAEAAEKEKRRAKREAAKARRAAEAAAS